MPPLLSSQVRLGDPTGTADAPAPSAWDTLGASVNSTVDRIPDVQDWRIREAYAGLAVTLRDLNDAGYLRYNNPVGSLFGDHFDEEQIWVDIASLRQSDPERFKNLPSSRAEFEKQVLTRHGRADRDAQTAARGGAVPRVVGGIVGSFRDPRNIAATIVSGGGSSILSAMGREAVVNMVIEGAQTPQNIIAARRLGDDPGARDVAANILMAGLGAAAITGTVKGIGRASTGGIDAVRGRFEKLVADNWDKLPAPLRERWGSAANVDGTALPDVFEAIVGRDNMSLNEKGAVALLRREAEIDAVNPFRPDGAGVEAHNAAVARNVERIAAEIQGMRAPRSVAAGDATAIASGTVPSPSPVSGARSAIKAKIGAAESPNDIAKNPRSSATGRYQFVSGTWLAYYKRRFGSQGLTDAQILAKRTDGQVQDILMDDLLADNARFLAGEGQPETAGNLYLTHFAGQGGARKLFRADPRAAAIDVLGADVIRANPFLKGMTARDVIAWAARKMDEAPSARGGVGRATGDGIDPEAAVRADLQARSAALEVERAAIDAETAGRAANDDMPIEAARLGDDIADAAPAPMPELKRDLFPDETSWRIAQAAVDAEAMGLPEPMLTRQSVWIDARDRLIEARAGDVPGALYHPDVGPIDVKWGEAPKGTKQGFGLAKIVEKHPEVLDDLPAILGEMTVTSRNANRIQMESADHKAAVRLEWDGKEQTWLLTAFRKEGEGKAPPRRRTDVPGIGARDGSPARGAGEIVAENAADRNGAAGGVPMDRFWGDPAAPRDAGGLTAAERASLDFDEPGLADFVEPAGEGGRLDLDGSLHDLRASLDAEDPLSGVAFATREGIDETPADALAAIEAEEAALKALRDCL